MVRQALRATVMLAAVLVLAAASLDVRGTGASAAGDPVIAAAGDIACDPAEPAYHNGAGDATHCHEVQTSDLMMSGVDAVLPLGDDQYECGGLAAFQQSYERSWGRLKSITHPAIGNHDYKGADASTLGYTPTDCAHNASTPGSGYFAYFGAAGGDPAKGYYSYDIGTWHLIALNSNCGHAGGCGAGSPQEVWLRNDLATHPNRCTIAYMHHPRWSSAEYLSSQFTEYDTFWRDLVAGGGDVFLVAHTHHYERFAPMDGNGAADANGVREFIVGTGGRHVHVDDVTVQPNSQVIDTTWTFGVLKLTLHPSSYDWQFVPEAGKTFTDSGTASCNGGTSPIDNPPSVPGGLTATPSGTSEVDLRWNASTDNDATGVAGYRVYRNGVLAGDVAGTSFADTGLAAATTYSYTVSAYDTANNESGRSTAVPATTGTAGGGSAGTFEPVADAYVDASTPGSNFGSSTKLRTDTSPVVTSYLRFSVSGLSGTVNSVALKVYATSAQSSGFAVDAVSDTTWGETGITSANAPPLGAQLGVSGAAVAGSYVTVNLPPSAVTGNGLVSFALVGRSSTALALASRESSTRPQLVVTTSGGSGGDSTDPSVPTGLSATANGTTRVDLTWSASADEPGGSGLKGYNVYRGTTKVTPTPTTGTSFSDTGLTPSTTYSYTVTAVDNAGNESAPSDPASATTAAATDTTPPSDPGNLQPTVSATAVSLTWSAGTDTGGSGVAGYNVYRGATKLNTSLVTTTSYTDSTVAAGTTYTYRVTTVDGAGNESTPGASTTVTTPSGGGGGTSTFEPVADTYVDSSTPGTSFGTNVKLRVDSSPTVRSYLRFSVSGLGGTVTSVQLRIFATSALAAGFEVDSVASNSWAESITYSAAPAFGPPLALSGPATVGAWVTVNLPTSAVAGNGNVSFALVGRSTTALALGSRESTTKPQLIVTTS
jgi:chitodextrinase